MTTEKYNEPYIGPNRSTGTTSVDMIRVGSTVLQLARAGNEIENGAAVNPWHLYIPKGVQ